MKKSTLLFLLSVFMLFINSCHEDEFQIEEDVLLKSALQNDKEIIEEAQAWFESNPEKNKFKLLESADKLKWGKTVVNDLDSLLLVEVPIKFKNNFKLQIDGNEKLNIESRIIFLNKNGIYSSLLEFYISYMDKEKLQDVQKINYNNRYKNFEGTILQINNSDEVVSVEKIEENYLKSASSYNCLVLVEDLTGRIVGVLYCYPVPEDSNNSGGGGGSSSSGTTNETITEEIEADNLDCNFANSIGIDCDVFYAFEQDYKSQMSTSEQEIFDNMARIDQLSYLANAQFATWEAENLFPNSLYNGKGDAFRHAYWNALNRIDLGYELAESLTTAHENKPSTYHFSYKEKEMDLFNNEVGREKYKYFRGHYSSLESCILDALNNGELRYLSNLAPDGKATNRSQLTPTNQ
ncbi:hypothetical protein GM418_16775 [Maribellus comscasis]|uniref:DUF6973 domain-containing protein n=1 Tax=Maribellus comscasis TaxID=2681766 RepID=A0A6I6JQJ6_9BACT|nr:hypothetical protein [Maribellus comscasis]QGY45265.1 hypothetical protein GM418_16775 [Maribellus comscasis]